jgi:hypothetical protein
MEAQVAARFEPTQVAPSVFKTDALPFSRTAFDKKH